MDMVVVVHPTLEEYSSQVRSMAVKYGVETWLELFEHPEKMSPEDQDDFSFITMAVGDQLIHREFERPVQPPKNEVEEFQVEPGCIPGSTVLVGVTVDCRRVRGTYQ